MALFVCQKCGKTLEEADFVWVKQGNGFVFTVPLLLKDKLGGIVPRHMETSCWGTITILPDEEEG